MSFCASQEEQLYCLQKEAGVGSECLAVGWGREQHSSQGELEEQAAGRAATNRARRKVTLPLLNPSPILCVPTSPKNAVPLAATSLASPGAAWALQCHPKHAVACSRPHTMARLRAARREEGRDPSQGFRLLAEETSALGQVQRRVGLVRFDPSQPEKPLTQLKKLQVSDLPLPLSV